MSARKETLMTLTVKQSDQTKGWYVCDEDGSVVSDVQDTKREALAMRRKFNANRKAKDTGGCHEHGCASPCQYSGLTHE